MPYAFNKTKENKKENNPQVYFEKYKKDKDIIIIYHREGDKK